MTHDFIQDRVRVNHNGCWLWTSFVNPRTLYAQSGGKLMHRAAYELYVGPIPEGHHLDHRKTCPKHCINPEHLTPVSPAVNSQLVWTRKRGQMPRKALRVSRWLHKQVTERL